MLPSGSLKFHWGQSAVILGGDITNCCSVSFALVFIQVKAQVNHHSGNCRTHYCVLHHTRMHARTHARTHTHTQHTHTHMHTHTTHTTHTHTLNFNPHNYSRYYDQIAYKLPVTDSEQEPKTVLVTDTGSGKTTQPVFPQNLQTPSK